MLLKTTLLTTSILLILGVQQQNAFAESEFNTSDYVQDDEFSDEDGYEDEFADFYGGTEFISIATGTEKSINKAPAVASVITASDIERMGALNLGQALSMVPGLNISHSGQIMAPKFNFRGITSTYNPQTLFMMNGVATTSMVRGDNHSAWGEFPVAAISRIEIIRGPGSALYGADAFSGVINVITKDVEELNDSTVGVKLGSFNSKGAWVSSANSNGELRFGLSLEYSESDGHKKRITQDAQFSLDILADQLFGLAPVSQAPGAVNVGFEAFDIFTKVNYKDLTANISYQDRSNVGTGQGVTEALDPIGKMGHTKFIFDLNHDFDNFAPNWTLQSRFNYYRSTQNIDENLQLFPAGTFFGAFPEGLSGNPEWKESTTTLSVKANYTGTSSHFLSVGAGYIYQDLFEVTESKNFLADLTPRPDGLEDVSDTVEVFMPETDRNNKYAFVQDIWQIAPDWELTAGIRYDYYSDFGGTLNPRLALVWSKSLNSTFKFLYGRAFRAPSIAELTTVNNPVALGNPDLSPETIDSIEGAYIFKHSEHYSTSINLFYYRIEDFINFVPDVGATTSTAQNIGERTGYGLELETGLSITENFGIKSSYSYVKAKDDLLNDDVGDYPNHQIKAEINWRISDSVNLDSTINYVGERKRHPFDARDPLGSFVDVSLALHYRPLKSGWKFSLIGKNVLNDDIFEPSTGPSTVGGPVNIPNDLPQAGPSVFLTIEKDI